MQIVACCFAKKDLPHCGEEPHKGTLLFESERWSLCDVLTNFDDVMN